MASDPTLRGVAPATPRYLSADSQGSSDRETPRSASDDMTQTGERRSDDLVVLGPGAILEHRYRLEERIGRGGMGEVWRGTHLVLGRAIAIKLLIPDARPDSTRADRMMREARLVGRIDHPHVVEILDTGETPSGLPFLVMPLVDGAPLSSHLRRGPLTPDHALTLALQLCEALHAAHAVGVLHRDLKPGNVLVRGLEGDAPHCTLIDFGIAKATQWGPRESTLTNTGVVYGTPSYMSPEQARGQPLDVRADVYALGVLLFEMLTGTRPFRAPTPAELLYLQLFVPPPLPSLACPGHAIPAGLDAIVRRALYKDREHRFADMAEMGAALQAVREGVALPLPEVDQPVVPVEIQRRRTVLAQPVEANAARPAAAPRPRVAASTPWVIALAAVVLVLAASVAWWLRSRIEASDDAVAPPPETPAAAPGPAAASPEPTPAIEPAAPPPSEPPPSAVAPTDAGASAVDTEAAPKTLDTPTRREPVRTRPRREPTRPREPTPTAAEPTPATPVSPPRPDADGIIR